MIKLQLQKQLSGLCLDIHCELGTEVSVITGVSGSGKTTILKMIAGLIQPDEGRIQVKGNLLLDTQRKVNIASHQRGIGFVFQEDRLFPHLNVQSNLLFGAPKGTHRLEKMYQLVELLGLGPLLKRNPSQLSGGERQRVAIGRALLKEPQLLLMDEPFSSLDSARKAELLPYLKDVVNRFQIPTLYVTHDESEAEFLAQTRMYLNNGQLTQGS